MRTRDREVAAVAGAVELAVAEPLEVAGGLLERPFQERPAGVPLVDTTVIGGRLTWQAG